MGGGENERSEKMVSERSSAGTGLQTPEQESEQDSPCGTHSTDVCCCINTPDLFLTQFMSSAVHLLCWI